jgi:hypothetical protein
MDLWTSPQVIALAGQRRKALASGETGRPAFGGPAVLEGKRGDHTFVTRPFRLRAE